MKKGRHRRYEEVRKAKRGLAMPKQRCEECGGDEERGHASWCLAATEDLEFEEVGDEEF